MTSVALTTSRRWFLAFSSARSRRTKSAADGWALTNSGHGCSPYSRAKGQAKGPVGRVQGWVTRHWVSYPARRLERRLRADVGPGGVASGNVAGGGVCSRIYRSAKGACRLCRRARLSCAAIRLSEREATGADVQLAGELDAHWDACAYRPHAAAPAGPLATPSGQGGIGSDYAASARNIPLKRRAGAPNLGYYAGGNSPTSMGGARNPTWTPYTNPNDPRIYRG